MKVVEVVRDATGKPVGQVSSFEAFGDWTPEALAGLRGLGTLETVAAGATLLEAGPADDRALFVVIEGELEVDRGGRHRAVLEPGALIGEIAFVDGAPRTARITALTPARVLRVRPADVDRLAERDPIAALRFTQEISRVLSFRLRTAWS